MLTQKTTFGTNIFGAGALSGIALAMLLFTAAAFAQPQAAATPLSPQPDEQSLQPGLAAYYYKKKIRHLGRFPTHGWRPGKPILELNHRFGKKAVFGSGLSRTICVKMEGVLGLHQAGTYQFKALSNDGIRITIGGVVVAEDPSVHSDRFTEPVAIQIETPGWYPVLVEYFQRKGTAALQFHWQPPGSEAFGIVPAQAYAHVPSE